MNPSEETFLKQRRKLNVSALLVAFLNVAGGNLRKLSLLGNEIEFTNSKVIPIALGLALAYFLIRYLQYAHDVEDKGFQGRFQRKVESYMAPYLMRREFKRPDSRLGKTFRNLNEIEVEAFIMFGSGMSRNMAAASFIGKLGGVSFGENLKVTNWELVWPYIKAAAYIAFRTRLGTDYVLPLILSIAAFLTYFRAVRALVAAWL